MFDLVVLAGIFLVPSLTGLALGFWRYGVFVALGLAVLASGLGVFFLIRGIQPGEDPLAYAVLINLLVLVAAELAGGWALGAGVKFLMGRRAKSL